MAGDISLTSGMRSNLISLQGTVDLLNRTQDRLSSGKKVNSALDNPTSFFAAQAYAGLKRNEEAQVAYRKALSVAQEHMELNPDDPRAATMCAVACCRLGQPGRGLEWAERALHIDPDDAGVRYNVACLYALEGSSERAIDCLEEAFRRGFGNKEWIARDPDLESLRDDPRYQKLLVSGTVEEH